MSDLGQKIWNTYSKCRVLWYAHKVGDVKYGPDKVPSFSPEKLVEVINNTSGVAVELASDGGSDIMQASWHKDIAQPAGVFSVTLKPRRDGKDWADLIKASDVLVVFMASEIGRPQTFVTMISVDTVYRTVMVDGSGATVEMASVNGRDFGKILSETSTVFDPSFTAAEMAQFFSELTSNNIKNFVGHPSQVVQGILSAFYSGRAGGTGTDISSLKPLRFPGIDMPLTALLDIKRFVQTDMVGLSTLPFEMLQSADNMWSLLNMYANRCVNEFFIDVREVSDEERAPHLRMAAIARAINRAWSGKLESGSAAEDQQAQDIANSADAALMPDAELTDQDGFVKLSRKLSTPSETVDRRKALGKNTTIALVHRQMPYDTVSFLMLPEVSVQETEVQSVNIGRSAREVLNFFRFKLQTAGIEGLAASLQFGLVINRASIQKHGLKRHEGESLYSWAVKADTSGKTSLNFVPIYQFYIDLLSTWHAYNDLLYTGTMTMRLRPDIRVGKRLRYYHTKNGKPRIMDLYVQSVDHAFSAQPGASRTTVQLTRGISTDYKNRPEAQLYWTERGGMLPLKPYETVTPAGLTQQSFSDTTLGKVLNVASPVVDWIMGGSGWFTDPERNPRNRGGEGGA